MVFIEFDESKLTGDAHHAASPRSGNPPLASLANHAPASVQYLLPLRASGDFLAWLNANPTSPRADLERYLVLVYPPGTNTAPILAALSADAAVRAASVPPVLRPSAATLLNYGIAREAAAPASPTQYGRVALNVNAAWQMLG